MPFAYNRLVECKAIANSVQTQFANPAGKTTYIRSISIHNAAAVTIPFGLYNVPDVAGAVGVAGATNCFYLNTIGLQPGEILTFEFTPPGIILEDLNDTIQTYASDLTGALSFQMFGAIETTIAPTFNYKRIIEMQALPLVTTTIFANPAATTTYIKLLILCNLDPSSNYVRVWNVPDAAGAVGVVSDGTQIFGDSVLGMAAEETVIMEFLDGGLMLEDLNDTIQAISVAPTTWSPTIQAFGAQE